MFLSAAYNLQTATFSFKYGPVFSNIVLIDEINRSPAKTQAALFEVMEEKQITYDGVTYPIPQPFMVLAHKGIIAHFSEEVQSVLSGEDIMQIRELVSNVHIEAKVLKYIAELVYETRNNKALFLGASPRASVAVLRAAKAIAAISGRDFVTPDDVVKVLHPVLCHRIILTPEKEMEGGTAADVIKDITKKIEVPR